MKKVLTILCILGILSGSLFAQSEVGISVGTSNFLGDLGKKDPGGSNYFGDLEASLFKPAVQVHYRYYVNNRFSLKGALTYTQFAGDDRLANTTEFRDDAWFRNYRNLHFKSIAIELSATAEFNIMKYEPGSMDHRWSPYIFAGVSMFAFDPRAEYNGEWVRLQPLGTEGQGLPGYPERKKYSLIQPSLPLGIGFKFNVNQYLAVGFELGHRITFTDYIDDVSTTYPGDQAFLNYYGTERANMVADLSRRSPELDPEGNYGAITEAGEWRGNPGGKDQYLVSVLSVSYNLSKRTRKHGQPFSRNSTKRYKRVFK